MYHIKFKPDPAMWGNGPYPTVLMIPPALFRNGDASGSAKERVATKDLIDAGFLVFQIEHRLAPAGLLEDQTPHCNPDFSPCPIIEQASGRPPQQTDDVKQQILAALDDGDCNGKIFLIGGSSGGCHALWVALDATAGNITDWTPEVRGKIKGVVGLSAPTDLPLRDHDDGVNIEHFADTVENYTNTFGAQDWLQKQRAASPITLVANATNIPPIRLYATDGDSVPYQQAEEMRDALVTGGADVIEYTMMGSEHCFNYWHMINNWTQMCVSTEVIAFLNAHKNDP